MTTPPDYPPGYEPFYCERCGGIRQCRTVRTADMWQWFCETCGALCDQEPVDWDDQRWETAE